MPVRTGIFDILPEGYGFLRTNGYLPGNDDVYVLLGQIRRFQLRKRTGKDGEEKEFKSDHLAFHRYVEGLMEDHGLAYS